jgi:hypothetical protein
LVAISTAIPIAIIDYALTTTLHLAPLSRLPVLVVLFILNFLAASRALSVFTEADFELLENALPEALRSVLEVVERLLAHEREWAQE